jgi:exosortase E/protease (VPEID-CTERM system)
VSLQSRFLLLSVLFAAELIALTIWLDGAQLVDKGGLLALLGYSGSWILRGLVAFAAIEVTFAVLAKRTELAEVAAEAALAKPLDAPLLAGHFATLAIFGILAQLIYTLHLSPFSANALAAVWMISGLAAIALASGSLIPLRLWTRLQRINGTLWIYALLASVTACLIGAFARDLWGSAALWTFVIVKAFLKVVLPGVFADLATLSIGTPAFHVEIAPQCSGLEGAALILSFTALWLWLLRREFRFPRALLLAPASVAVLFLLNAFRIAALILIGNAGAPEIALGGFHSQAGWVAFNAVAIGLMAASRRVHWLSAAGYPAEKSVPEAVVEENPAAPYLMPFLAILAASMVSSAASSGFEWLYPLRLIAAAAALWIYRKHYRQLDWHFGWQAPVVGAVVFVMWLGGDWIKGLHQPYPITPSPDPWVFAAQNLWLVCRLIAPIVTVPIAEELAFRGYLIRRVVSRDFASLHFTTYTTLSLLISSLAFGVLHGNRWIAGSLAGLLYAAVYVRRGRIGDAVVAHAMTNGLLALSVLVTGQWNLS